MNHHKCVYIFNSYLLNNTFLHSRLYVSSAPPGVRSAATSVASVPPSTGTWKNTLQRPSTTTPVSSATRGLRSWTASSSTNWKATQTSISSAVYRGSDQTLFVTCWKMQKIKTTLKSKVATIEVHHVHQCVSSHSLLLEFNKWLRIWSQIKKKQKAEYCLFFCNFNLDESFKKKNLKFMFYEMHSNCTTKFFLFGR